MKSLGLIAKIAFGILIIMAGINHFTHASELTNLVPSSFPVREVFVYITGLAFVAAGVSLIINKKAQLAMLLLGVMLILFAVLIWQGKNVNIMFRDLMIAAAAWFMSAHVND